MNPRASEPPGWFELRIEGTVLDSLDVADPASAWAALETPPSAIPFQVQVAG